MGNVPFHVFAYARAQCSRVAKCPSDNASTFSSSFPPHANRNNTYHKSPHPWILNLEGRGSRIFSCVNLYVQQHGTSEDGKTASLNTIMTRKSDNRASPIGTAPHSAFTNREQNISDIPVVSCSSPKSGSPRSG